MLVETRVDELRSRLNGLLEAILLAEDFFDDFFGDFNEGILVEDL